MTRIYTKKVKKTLTPGKICFWMKGGNSSNSICLIVVSSKEFSIDELVLFHIKLLWLH